MEKMLGLQKFKLDYLVLKLKIVSTFKKFKKDKHSAVGLTKSVNKRKKLLDYLKRKTPSRIQKY